MKAYEIDNYFDLLGAAEANANSDWEMTFVSDMMQRYADYEDECYVSEKQLEILERIADQ